MKILEKYIINPSTIMIMEVRDQKGRTYSKVVETKESYIVTMRPKALIDSSMRHYAASLQGAYEGSRAILGNISMLPIMVSNELDLYFFPCFSPERHDCIWLSLGHIEKAEKHNPDETIVQFKQGNSVVISMKIERFDRKLHRASQLRYIIVERAKKMGHLLS